MKRKKVPVNHKEKVPVKRKEEVSVKRKEEVSVKRKEEVSVQKQCMMIRGVNDNILSTNSLIPDDVVCQFLNLMKMTLDKCRNWIKNAS